MKKTGKNMKPQMLIAAANSGSGKTTVSIGLMRALVRSGLAVQPFKCGPDYIDTQFHAIASGKPSVNLDTFMASRHWIASTYARWMEPGDVAVVEGVMGAFDGFDRSHGSSAEIAKVLRLPVILVVNARSTAYSVAALIHGFTTFDPAVKIMGVIFNMVGSYRHGEMLRQACKDAKVECLGCIPRINGLEVPSRHLGLTVGQKEDINQFADLAADAIEKHIDIDRLLKIVQCQCENFNGHIYHNPKRLRIGIARDEAFSFSYQDNLETWKDNELCFFSPIRSQNLPDKIDLLYLPGGYPELYAQALGGNNFMRKAIKEYAENGGKILAECGGMIYLTEEIDGQPMSGVFPLKTTMEGAKLRLGYRQTTINGQKMRGHEFHYSKIVGKMSSIAQLFNAQGEAVDTPVYRYKNVIASYTHWYWPNQNIMKLWD